MTLDEQDIERLAARIVQLLRETPAHDAKPRYVTAAVLARMLSVERDWVYAHAHQLGALRLGGPRGRLRFDRHALHRLAIDPQNNPASLRAPAAGPAAKRRTRGTCAVAAGPVRLLPVRLESPQSSQAAGRRANAPGPTTGG